MIFREARRFLRSSRLLSVSAILIVALGIGASALALSLLMALSSLSYPGMQAIGYATVAEETEGGGSVPITWQRFEELRTSSAGNTTLAAYSRPIHTTLEVNGASSPLRVAAVSSNFFPSFTTGLIAGRDFSRVEEGRAGRHVIILSSSLAASLFKSSENAAGQFILVDGLAYEVAGVAGPDFRGVFGDQVQAWVPANCVIPLVLKTPPGGFADSEIWKSAAVFFGVAASTRASSADLVSDLTHSLPLHKVGDAALHASQGLTNDPMRDAKSRRWLRFGLLLALVFTIVSGLNYSLLLLAGTPRLADEVRLKKALGAGSVRLMTELMIGPATMVGAGLLAALIFFACGMAMISRQSEFYADLVRGSWSASVLAFGAQVPLACALTLVIALIPALGLLRDDGAPRMGYTSTARWQVSLLLQALVTLQMTFCIGTWILAGMTISAVASMTREPPGFDLSHLTVICIRPAYGTVSFTFGAEKKTSFPTASAIGNLLTQVSTVPGVRSASFASSAPLDEPMGTLTLQRMDTTSAPPRTAYNADVSPEYFRTMGTTIVRGRDFSSHNLIGDVHEIIINETLERELWPNDNPINQSLKLTDSGVGGIPSNTFAATVVGVVEDMRLSGVMASPEPTVFLSLNGLSFFDITPYLIVNGSASIHSLEDLANREVASQMPGLGVLDVYSVNARARASLQQEKERAYFALAGALAMAIVAYVGLYGALAYYVGTRRRELAVRICLGASPRAIIKLILARAAACAVSAVVFSLPLWPLLFQLSSSEYLGRVSWSLARAALLSMACVSVAVFIALFPAVRATRVSPADVLREQ